MKIICIKQLFVTQCKECKNVVYHSDMDDTHHISNIEYCPYCGHKLNKENKEFVDITDD